MLAPLRTALLILCLASSWIYADDDEDKRGEINDEIKVTEHSLSTPQGELSYRATVGTFVLRDLDDEDSAKAQLFFMAYTLKDTEELGKRPVTFIFNGGPGSSSVWLHLGCLGPRRLAIPNDLESVRPPAKLVDNEHSLLTHSDLVFIDPISTGFSRPLAGEDPKQFHGFEEDIQWVAEFIRLYCTRYKRWLSPKYLCGESYGTIRASGLAAYLHREMHMAFNGVVLISPILQWHVHEPFERDPGNDLPYILNLSSLAATAWYHKKIAPDLQDDMQKAIAEARAFALTDYTLALMQGDQLSPRESDNIVDQLHRYTGLSKEFIRQNHLRIHYLRFVKELLREEGHTIGRFDSRIKGIDREPAGEFFAYDPSYDNIVGAYTSTLNHYVRDELDWEYDRPYRIIGNVRPWNWAREDESPGSFNVADDLRDAMVKNPHLKVLALNGYFDLATPFAANEYTFSHMGLPSSLRQNLSMRYYKGGHMMYNNAEVLAELMSDLRGFYEVSHN